MNALKLSTVVAAIMLGMMARRVLAPLATLA
jgi:hypothetical protein